jgi:two-component system, NarL family, nitrate/nitrite response regulator NarL
MHSRESARLTHYDRHDVMVEPRADSIKIVIVDDHAVMSAGLRMIIEREPLMRVVGEASDGAEAIRLVFATQPNIILLDLDLGDESGLDLMPKLLGAAPNARVILLTGLRDPEVHRRGVLLGAMGVVLKEKSIDTVIRAVEKVHAGEVWLDRTMLASILNTRAVAVGAREQQSVAARIATLTEREREVIKLLGRGFRNKRIAEELIISEATVRHHLTSIFAKLGVADRFELVIFAYRHGLAEIPG